MLRFLPEFVFPLTFPVSYSSPIPLAFCFINELLRSIFTVVCKHDPEVISEKIHKGAHFDRNMIDICATGNKIHTSP